LKTNFRQLNSAARNRTAFKFNARLLQKVNFDKKNLPRPRFIRKRCSTGRIFRFVRDRKCFGKRFPYVRDYPPDVDESGNVRRLAAYLENSGTFTAIRRSISAANRLWPGKINRSKRINESHPSYWVRCLTYR